MRPQDYDQKQQGGPSHLGKRAPAKEYWATKKPRSDNEESKGGDSRRGRKDPEEKGGDGGFVVDLELMSALMKKKGSRTIEAKKKATTQKNLDSTDKTK
jgi:hypothetical protein